MKDMIQEVWRESFTLANYDDPPLVFFVQRLSLIAGVDESEDAYCILVFISGNSGKLHSSSDWKTAP